MIKFGLIPELIGRLPVLAKLGNLDEDALVNILTQPKNALVKQYGALFDMENVELEITNNALIAIAKKALERKTGARGLRAIVEETLLDTMFKLPSRKDIAKVIVDEATVSDRQPPQLIPVEAAGSHKKATPLHSLAS